VIILFLPHILFLKNGYVDLEIYPVRAAQDILQNGIHAHLADYFATVVNPLFSVLLLAGSFSVFGESPLVSRLTILLLATAFVAFLYFYLKNKKGLSIAAITTLLVIVNPMFIVYSQYVYSDIPGMVFASISLLMLLSVSSISGNIISAIMLGLAFATKYVTAVLFPVALLFSLVRTRIFSLFSRKKLLDLVRFNLWYFALALLVSVPIIAIVLRYQAGLLTPQYESMLVLQPAMFLPRFFSYLLWLGLFLGPSCVIPLTALWARLGKKRFLFLLAALVLVTLVISRFYPIVSLHQQEGSFGEMNLGWVESKIPSLYLSVAFFFVLLIAELFISNLVCEFKEADPQARNIFIWILLPLLLMSFIRVANRYVLFLLVPISLYLALRAVHLHNAGKTQQWLVRVILPLHAVIFLAVGFYSNYYLSMRGLTG
jgi:hypothetical protein